MKSVVIAMSFLAVSGGFAWAGLHEGGVLALHHHDGATYTAGDSYCGAEGVDCDSLDTSAPGLTTNVLGLIALFSDAHSPRLGGVSFGIAYDDSLVGIVDYGNCGDFELAETSWPGPSSGVSVTWSSPQESLVVPIYWFATYSYYMTPTSLQVTNHVDRSAAFVDADTGVIDEIGDLGVVGFEDDGYAPCPTAPVEKGACCLPDGCEYVYPDDCAVEFFPGQFCLPNPCEPVIPVTTYSHPPAVETLVDIFVEEHVRLYSVVKDLSTGHLLERGVAFLYVDDVSGSTRPLYPGASAVGRTIIARRTLAGGAIDFDLVLREDIDSGLAIAIYVPGYVPYESTVANWELALAGAGSAEIALQPMP